MGDPEARDLRPAQNRLFLASFSLCMKQCLSAMPSLNARDVTVFPAEAEPSKCSSMCRRDVKPPPAAPATDPRAEATVSWPMLGSRGAIRSKRGVCCVYRRGEGGQKL